MGVRIKRDGLRFFIQEVSEDELTTTISDLDIDVLVDQAEQDERAYAEKRQAADKAYEAHAFDTADRIATEVAGDIRHHFNKFGAQRLDGFNWIAVVTEEWGETVAAYNQQDYEGVVKEGKQAIACIMRLINEVEREMSGANVMEKALYSRAQ